MFPLKKTFSFFLLKEKALMACCGNFNGQLGAKSATLLEFNGQDWCDKYWRTDLSQQDGVVKTDAEGLIVNSSTFTAVAPTGLFQSFAWNAYYQQPLYTRRGTELIAEAVIAGKQYFNASKPIPDTYSKRVRDIFADARLAHSQFSLIDPDNGIIAGFALTDHAIYALYGRLPLSQWNDWCNWAAETNNECKPCRDACDKKYTCSNFWEDCRYIAFKQNSSFREYLRFIRFLKWADYCGGVNIDLFNQDVYLDWSVGNACDLGEDNFVAWKSWNDWNEYCQFLRWLQWETLEKNWGRCKKGPCGPCGGCTTGCGSCKRKLPEKCCHAFVCDVNCYAQTNKVKKTPESYSYQFGVQRCCCETCAANFIDLVEVQRTEACDPLCDFHKLAVGIDSCKSIIRWYINNTEVLKHVGIGRRMSEEFRVRENGGYAEDVQVGRVLVNFGTGSLLDASLPNNYSRYRAKDDTVDMTALVPLQSVPYYSIYHNKYGGLLPVNVAEGFAVASNDSANILFGQGAILRLKSLTVVQRVGHNDYSIWRIKCRKPQACNDKPGYCNDEGGYDSDIYGEDCDDGCGLDPRDFTIEGIPGVAPPALAGYGTSLPINALPTSLGTIGYGSTRDVSGAPNNGYYTPLILTRTPTNQRYWESPCGRDVNIAQDPYYA
jgi:hypothetical protein